MSASLQRAMACHAAGRLDEAERLYREVLAADPDQADAFALLGVLLSGRGEHEKAIKLIEQAVSLDVAAPLFRLHLGNAFMAAGQNKSAATQFRKAIELKPDFAEAHYNLGNALRGMEDWPGARDAYGAALGQRTNWLDAHNNLALVHEKQGNFSGAAKELQQVVALNPSAGEAWLRLSDCAAKTGHYDLALSAAQKAVELLPGHSIAQLRLAIALTRLDRDWEALAAYEAAVRFDPGFLEVWHNLGLMYQAVGRLDESEAAFRKAIDLAGQTILDEDRRPVAEEEYGRYYWDLSLVELQRGDYRRGFSHYRARFAKGKEFTRPDCPEPLWQGEPLAGKTIVVIAEQGYGDVFMFCRYVPRLKALGARVIFLVRPALIPFFTGWEGADIVASDVPADTRFDYHISIFDLPYRFGTTLESVPDTVPYLPLLPPDDKTRLSGDGRPKVGVIWAGRPDQVIDERAISRRTIPLGQMQVLFAMPGLQFFSLTRDLRPGDSELLAQYPVTDLAPMLDDFAVSARILGQLDLLISCDTGTAHLAGGMGKKVWTLLPYAPCWRWLMARDDSPWYPTMRLFRQRQPGDWGDVIARVRAALET